MAQLGNIQPSRKQIDEANRLCHAFIRAAIAEGVQPAEAIMYVPAFAAQVIKNAADMTNTDPETVLLMFMSNTAYYLSLIDESKRTSYEVPPRNN